NYTMSQVRRFCQRMEQKTARIRADLIQSSRDDQIGLQGSVWGAGKASARWRAGLGRFALVSPAANAPPPAGRVLGWCRRIVRISRGISRVRHRPKAPTPTSEW